MTVLHSSPSHPEAVGKSALAGHGWAGILFIALCFTVAGLTARDSLVNLYDRWGYEEEYGYGFLVLALVPLLCWRRWPTIRAAAVGPKWPGLLILVLAQLCAALGSLGESYFVEQIAFIFSLLGILMAVFGVGSGRQLVPLAFLLLLTIPLPYTLQAMLTIKLQLWSTNLGVAMIDLLGIPVWAEGNIIDLGRYKLEVAEACSGLRYFLPLTCISFLIAYLYQAPLWKKAVVFVSAVPISILINSFRIAVVAVLVDHFGPSMADGFLHQFEGWVVFQIGAVLLGLVVLGLQGFRWSRAALDGIFFGGRSPSDRQVRPIAINSSAIAALAICVAMLVVTSSIASTLDSGSIPDRQALASFPNRLGDWTGKQGRLDPGEEDVLKATDTYIGDFTQSSGPSVNLYVVYYASLTKSAAIHSPRVCLPGAGWEFAQFDELPFSDLVPTAPGSFNRLIVEKGEQKLLMYYWYQQRERRTANEFKMKYYLLIDRLAESRRDGALIRISTAFASHDEKGLAQADARLRSFLAAALPPLDNYVPR